MNKNKIIIVSLVFLLIIGISFYFFKKNDVKEELPFEVSTPIRQDLSQYVNASGTLRVKDEISVGSLVAGRVVNILADDNDFVRKDQVLAILDDGIGYSYVKKFKALLEEAKSNRSYYEKFYERQSQLYKANQISKDIFEQYTKEFDVLNSRVTQIEGDLEIKQQEYDNLFIKSPENGVIIAKEIDLGQMVTSRLQATVLYKIAKDLHFMEADVDVDEADVGLVQVGQDAFFTVDAFPKNKFKAKVKQIRYLAKIVDNVVTYATILDVDNPELKLRPGMTTNVDIRVRAVKNVLSVENRSLRINPIVLEEIAKKIGFNLKRIVNTDIDTALDSVWVLNGKTFEEIAVKLGAKHGAYTQIISDKIDDNSQVLTRANPLTRENLLLKQVFAKPGTIGSSKK